MSGFFRAWALLGALLFCPTAPAQASPPATAPYSPNWHARHHLQVLADETELPLLLTHWPQPSAAVVQALAALPPTLAPGLEAARQAVLDDLRRQTGQTQLTLSLRTRAEALNGFDDNYTPGSSATLRTSAWQHESEGRAWSLAARLGLRAEQQPASASRTLEGTLPATSANLEGSSLVLGLGGWNLQAFSHRSWWGPGWQSSLVNGSNAPAWQGLGLQRGQIAPSSSPWLSWMGPWNLEVFAAQTRDPLVAADQPRSPVFSGTRLTLKPRPWVELGFSRGLQFGGSGRPSGPGEFAKAFFGQQTNKEATDTFADSGGQIAGYDARLSCPSAWAGALGGRCAAYTQWMGEDAVGKYPPMPYKFMSLWGMEHTLGEGRHRLFAEYANTNAYSLPWDSKPQFPGYINGVYSQGYTQQTRWAGSAQGAGSRTWTLGWMDAELRQRLRLFAGQIGTSPGVYNPAATALPHGQARGLAWDRGWRVQGGELRTELAYLRLADGADAGALRRHNLRMGVALQWPLGEAAAR